MLPRFGDPYQHGRHYRARPGCYAVLQRGNALLLTFQAAPEPEYQLPGGGIDPGEQPLAALHREVFEETGWHIAGARHLTTYRRFGYMPEYDLWAEKICHLYLARPTLRLREDPPEPHHTAIWMPIDIALQRIAASGDRAFLRRLFRQP